MTSQLRVVQVLHAIDQVVGQAGHKHHLQLDVQVLQNVLQGPLGTELCDQHNLVWFHTGSNKAAKLKVFFYITIIQFYIFTFFYKLRDSIAM